MIKAAAFVLIGLCLSFIMACSSSAPAGEALAFRLHSVIDEQGFGEEAFRLLIPKDWTFEGGVTWHVGSAAPTAETAYAVSSPDGRSVLEQFPPMNMFWSQNPTVQSFHAQAGTTVMAPMDAIDFLQKVFIPEIRPEIEEVKVRETKALPEATQSNLEWQQIYKNIFDQISPPLYDYKIRADVGYVELEYTQDGERIIEDFLASVTYFDQYAPTMDFRMDPQTQWGGIVLSIRAPAEEMPGKVRLFQIITDSLRPNLVWNVNCTRQAAIITNEKLRDQQAMFARLRQIGQTLRDVSDIVTRTYENRSSANDRIFEKYSEATRGVDSYFDPVNNAKIDLPTGYNGAWTNGTEYLISDNANYNPNVGSAGDWKKLTRKK